jgi:hypothetical protein
MTIVTNYMENLRMYGGNNVEWNSSLGLETKVMYSQWWTLVAGKVNLSFFSNQATTSFAFTFC